MCGEPCTGCRPEVTEAPRDERPSRSALWAWVRSQALTWQQHPGAGGRDALEGGGGTPHPRPGRPACAQPLSPRRQVPVSMVFVTDSNRSQPLRQPPPTACLTASGTGFEILSLLMHPSGGGGGGGYQGVGVQAGPG